MPLKGYKQTKKHKKNAKDGRRKLMVKGENHYKTYIKKEREKERLFKHPQLLEHLYINLNMAQFRISSLLHVHTSQIRKWLIEFGIKKPPRKKSSDGHGYAYIDGRKVHLIVMEKKIDRSLKNGEVVHHINFDKSDNSPENLYLCKNGSVHGKIHTQFRRLSSQFVKEGIIGFNKEKGEYHLKIGQCPKCGWWTLEYERGEKEIIWTCFKKGCDCMYYEELE